MHIRAGIVACMLALAFGRAYAIDDVQVCKDDKSVPLARCLEDRLKKARIKLDSLSKLVTQQMIELDAATLRDEAAKAYESSDQSFRSFVRKNCAWKEAAVVGGATGNRNRMVCELNLVQMRLEELRAQLGH